MNQARYLEFVGYDHGVQAEVFDAFILEDAEGVDAGLDEVGGEMLVRLAGHGSFGAVDARESALPQQF